MGEGGEIERGRDGESQRERERALHLRHLQSSTDASSRTHFVPWLHHCPLEGPPGAPDVERPAAAEHTDKKTDSRAPLLPFPHPLTSSSITVLHLLEIKKAAGPPHSSCFPTSHLSTRSAVGGGGQGRERGGGDSQQDSGSLRDSPLLSLLPHNSPSPSLSLPPPHLPPPHRSLRKGFHWSS